MSYSSRDNKYKDSGLGLVLTGVFGSVGLLYSSITAAIVVFILEAVLGYTLWVYIQEVNSQLYIYRMMGISPVYHLGYYVLAFLGIRIVALLLSYYSVQEYNKKNDPDYQKPIASENVIHGSSYVESQSTKPLIIIIYSIIFIGAILGSIWLIFKA